MSFLNDAEFSKMYFYPQDIRCESAIDVAVNGVTLRCVYHQSDPSLPTLIHFHGNGEAVEHYVQMGYVPKLIAEVGDMNILLVEYRGYGGSTGDPQLVAMLEDGEALVHALNLDPIRCVAYGRSIGSLYALELASRFPNLGGLFLDSAIADVQYPFMIRLLDELLTPEGMERRQQILAEVNRYFSHQSKIANFRGKLVICHTERDQIIHVEDAKQLYMWASTFKKELRIYREGDHNSIFHFNSRDMLFALKRLMASIAPQCYSLPETSDEELIMAALLPGEKYRREADVFSPALPEWGDPYKRPTPKWMKPLPDVDQIRRPTEAPVVRSEPSPKRNVFERLSNWFVKK
ncbi:protein ABHD13-like [Physella acuta]|uniref:protein ABHD13-like n=1 Tax=Physella acuta TaxID=109671 RepID=UPI0027DCC401|nr:protein ABHD13-like [Physella acuta]